MSIRKLWKSLFLYAFVFCASIGSACFAVESPPSLSNANWLSMEFPGTIPPFVLASTCDSSGNLYISGPFKTKDVKPIPFGVAKWDGTKWTPFLSGADDSVSVDSLVYSSTDRTIYAAGYFEPKTGSAFSFAKWNGTNWSPLGKDYGTIDSYNLITCDSSGNLYASGTFKTATNVPFCFGKWNASTSAWIPLGTDYSVKSTNVRAIVCDLYGNLYAGGLLDGSSYSVAKWNGTGWSKLGTLKGTIKTLAFDLSGNLYAGGMFGDVSNNAFGVAKWDGSKWNFIGGKGFYYSVMTLAFDSSNNLYAGGYITNIADGVPANGIARWDGSTWSTIGSGTSGHVFSLSYSKVKLLNTGGNFKTELLYVGGTFITAGGKSSNCIAKLILPPPPGAPTTVTAVRGDTKATVSFTPPVSNGEFPLTSFEVTSNPDGIKATGTVSPIAVTRLTNGKSYTFTVKATNAIGPFGPASTASNSVIPATVPDAPTKVIVSPGNGQASVAFTLPFNGGSTITGYTVTSDPDGILKTGTASPIIVTGLTNGVKYNFYVTATNSLGISEPSDASVSVTPVIPITAIGAITGTAKVGSVLTAGALAPTTATVTYQWMRCAAATAITGDSIGLNQSTYLVDAADAGKFIKVQVTGIGGYSGIKLSAATAAVPTPLSGLAISGTVGVGQKLTAEPSQSNATVNYQWSSCATSDGTYAPISGATANTYTPTLAVVAKYLKVTATGISSYSGMVTSDPTATAVPTPPTPITAIGAIIGTAKVGSELTVGAVTPAGAAGSAYYTWRRCKTAVDLGERITSYVSSYKVSDDDVGYFIKVTAQGMDPYDGIVTSTATTAVPTPITVLPTIGGTAKVGQILTATVTPSLATVTYQWQSASISGGPYSNIVGATAKAYTLKATDVYKFIRIVVTGTVSYSGTVESSATAAVSPIPVTNIAAITGTAKVGSVLIAGAVTPSRATGTYQWTSCTVGGEYKNIDGAKAKTYTVGAAEIAKFIKVVAIGTGGYGSSATSPATTVVVSAPLTAIDTITGTVSVGSTLKAGALTPAAASATATYQWQSASTATGPWTSIGDSSGTYTIKNDDVGKLIRVKARASGYTGGVTSLATKAVPTPITAIGTISGTQTVGATLTAGTLTPTAATVSYQWQSADTSGGSYSNISGAILITYTLKASDAGKYIRVVATGTVSYSGTVPSEATAAVSPISVTAIGVITGTVKVGSILTAGALTPPVATVKYQWTSCPVGGEYKNIDGATLRTYTVGAAEIAKFIKVVATGTGGYGSSATSEATTAVPLVPLTAIGAITGTVKAGSMLTAGVLTPSGATATATYTWLSSDTSGGTYAPILGAPTTNTYVLQSSDAGMYIKVRATATGYTGTPTSVATGKVPTLLTTPTIIAPLTVVGQILTAAATPSGATVSYQWKRCDTSVDGDTGVNITGAISQKYTLVAADVNKFIKVVTTGFDKFSGTTLSAATAAVSPISVTDIATITGTAKVGSVLTAGAVTPSAATVTYQWTSCTTLGGTYENIGEAKARTYTVGAAEVTKFIKVVATGTGGYGSSATSAATTAVSPILLTAIGAITGTAKVDCTLMAAAVTPAGATFDYQWIKCDTAAATAGVPIGENKNTYTVIAADATKYIRVQAIGKTCYGGTVTSTATTAVPTPVTAIGAISGTPAVGSVLTAGAFTPVAATVSYQWSSCGTAGGTFVKIAGATATTYKPTTAVAAKYIKVTVTGTVGYSGSAESDAVGPVTAPVTAVAAITGTPKTGSVLTAGAVTPAGATVDYQWKRYDTATADTSVDIGANQNTYTTGEDDARKYIRLEVTGNGSYTGGVTSLATLIGASVPGAPVIGTVTPGNVRVDVKFTDPAFDGGSPIISYTVTSNPGSKTATGVASPIRVTGLTSGTSYTFTVKATNAAGTGPASAASSPAIPSINPSVTSNPFGRSVMVGDPATFKVTVTGTPTPTCLWQVSTDGGITWTDLKNDDVYTGVTTATMTIVNTTLDMSRYQYRCNMENIGGSAFSDAGILRVESYDTVLDGIDDLSTGDNWSAPTMAFGKGGRLTFTGSNLEYTVPSYSKYEDTAIMEWTPNVASYTKDWNVQVDVHLANIEQSYNTGLYLFAFNSATTLKFITFEYRGLSVFEYMDYVYVGLTPGGVESGVYSSYGVRLDGPKPKNISSGDATVKISFNSATKELTMFYSTDGGSTWIQNYKVSVAPYSPYDWGMGDNSTFSIMFVGYSSNRNVSSGDAYFSNFEASSP